MLFEDTIVTDSISEPREVLQVSQLNLIAKQTLEGVFACVWVEGEISNLSQPSSGHIYLTLKDDQAQIKGAFFKQSQRGCQIKLSHGQQVLVKAKVSLYAPRGDYQLIISHIEPAGAGRLQLEFEALKLKLQKEGLFEESRKQPVPLYPGSIGVVTSPTGAALQDIIHVLERRFPLTEIIVYPTLVQGSSASATIVKAIEAANRRMETDVLIVGRGGGSLEDLWPFNEEMVARAITASRIPVISAVGHQTDFTISDFAADVRAPTPSAAAELAVPDCRELFQQLNSYEQLLKQLLIKHIISLKQQISTLSRHIRHPLARILEQMQRLDEIYLRLKKATHTKIKSQQHDLNLSSTRLKYLNPKIKIRQHKSDLDKCRKKLNKAIQNLLNERTKSLDFLSQRLIGIGPQKTLERGYVIAQNQKGDVIHSKVIAESMEQLTLRFHDGTIQVQVQVQ